MIRQSGALLSILGVLACNLTQAQPAPRYEAAARDEALGRFGDAFDGYRQSIASEPAYRAFAQVRAALCRYNAGDEDGGREALETFLADAEPGPAVRMGQRYLAQWLAHAEPARAAELYAQALDITPRPWWMQKTLRTAANLWRTLPDYQTRGYDVLAEIVDTNRPTRATRPWPCGV